MVSSSKVSFNKITTFVHSSSGTIDHEIGAELLKSPISNSKLPWKFIDVEHVSFVCSIEKSYADSSFFNTPFNTYPTIEEQKKMARKIAAILESGDPTQKGASKFEKQRQRAEKYTVEADPIESQLSTSNYRPLRPIQSNDMSQANYQLHQHAADVPDCIKKSLNEAQFMNPLRYVGAPEDFKQIHMQVRIYRLMSIIDERTMGHCYLGTCDTYQCIATSSNESRC
jgi:hypothetical protein